ncbi:MAG: enoyl-CoA hydratase-related protein [Gammaproteobacteria bacterium]
MSNEFSLSKRNGRILEITINRPEVMNAVHPPASEELAAVFDEFAADPDLWVAIITGAGDRAFSAGNDLKYQAQGHAMTTPETGFAGLTSRFDLNKPIIAAVNGIAMGGGFEIALASDLIIADEKQAVFALPEPHVGLAALAGGLHRLPRQIGIKQAMGMILTGRRVTASEGMNMGFVTDIAPAGTVMERAREWAQQILECAPLSVQASKEAIHKGLEYASLEQAYRGKYPAVATMLKSEDLKEGPLAFAQKRRPNWKGC